MNPVTSLLEDDQGGVDLQGVDQEGLETVRAHQGRGMIPRDPLADFAQDVDVGGAGELRKLGQGILLVGQGVGGDGDEKGPFVAAGLLRGRGQAPGELLLERLDAPVR